MKDARSKVVKIELPAIPSELMGMLRQKGIATFEQLSEKEQTAVWEWSRTVIKAYRNTLETNQKNVRDLSELPFKKDDIKLAIRIALPLYISKNLHRMIRALKNAYKELGAFQDLDALGTVSADTNGERLIPSSKDSNMAIEGIDQNMELIVSEKKALTEEINGFVADLESAL